MLVDVQQRALAGRVGTERKRYAGQVVYLFAFDLAYELADRPISSLLGQPVVPFRIGADKRMPQAHPFYEPLMVRLPPVERVGPQGPVQVDRAIKILPVGSISITVSVPFQAEHIEELVVFHDLRFESGALDDEVRELAEQVRHELRPYCIRPVAQLPEEEAYTVFCLEAPLTDPEGLPLNAEAWLQAHRRQVAALLTQELDIHELSQQEAEESTSRYLSYYRSDLVVIDWDAALVVDEPADLEEVLYVMELANLELAELEAYDRLLDAALERSYRDLADRSLRGRAHVLQQVKELRIDMARLNDALSNITKLFGDWHLARIHQVMAARFHLADWHRTVNEKLKTLDDLYQLLCHERDSRWMLMLEATIVLLFIIDLVILVVGLKG